MAQAGLTEGLVLETDEVSTYVGALEAPAEQRLARYVAALIAAASRHSGAGHVVAHLLMVPIQAAIAAAQDRGTASGAAHYATKLTGDVAEVVATAVDAWAQVGASVPHVVTHLTISIGSPSLQQHR